MLLLLCYVRFTQQKGIKCKEMDRMNTNIRGRAQQAGAAHRANIQKSLQHRLEVARANGDESLIRQLEAEVNYYN